VADRSGNPVRGLTVDRFEIHDNGASVSPSFFEVIDLSVVGDAETARVVSRHPVASRNFLLLFDLNTISLNGLTRAQNAAKEFVSHDIGERDTVAIATFNADAGIRLLAGFTRNQEILIHAITTMGHERYYRIADPLRIGFLDNRVGSGDSWNESDVYIPPDPAALLTGEQIIEELVQDANRHPVGAQDDLAENMIRGQLDGLGQVATLLDSIPGQKQILFLTEGFDSRALTGRDVESLDTRNEFEAAIKGQIWRVNTDQRFGRTSLKDDLDAMAQIFRRSDVVLHTFDVGGVRSTTDAASGFKRSSNESLFLIANPTGGRVFKNENDMKANFDAMLREQEVVYLLGFHAKRTGEAGGYHELRVEVSGLPFGATVRHRMSYNETSGGPGLARALSASEIFALDIPRTDIGVTPTVLPLPPAERRRNVPVFLQIDGESLAEILGEQASTLEVMIYAFTESEAAVDYAYDLVTVSPESREAILAAGLGYYAELRLPPGRYSIESLVRDRKSGKDGFARTEVTVPGAGELSVVGPFLVEGPRERPVFWKHDPAKSESVYPLAMEDRIAVPALHPVLQSGGVYVTALLAAGDTRDLAVDAIVREVSTNREIPTKLKLLSRTPGRTPATELFLLEFRPADLHAWTDYVLEVGVAAAGGARQIHVMSFEGGA